MIGSNIVDDGSINIKITFLQTWWNGCPAETIAAGTKVTRTGERSEKGWFLLGFIHIATSLFRVFQCSGEGWTNKKQQVDAVHIFVIICGEVSWPWQSYPCIVPCFHVVMTSIMFMSWWPLSCELLTTEFALMTSLGNFRSQVKFKSSCISSKESHAECWKFVLDLWNIWRRFWSVHIFAYSATVLYSCYGDDGYYSTWNK